jgi:hypothetical protein
VCRFVRERYWDGYGWVYRRVEASARDQSIIGLH